MAAAQVLRLRCGEFELVRAPDAERIRAQGLKLRRQIASSNTRTRIVHNEYVKFER